MIDLLGMVDCAGRGQAATLPQRSCLLSFYRACHGGALMADPAVNWTADELNPCLTCAAGIERWTRLEADPGALAAFNEFAAGSEDRFKKGLQNLRVLRRSKENISITSPIPNNRYRVARVRDVSTSAAAGEDRGVTSTREREGLSPSQKRSVPGMVKSAEKVRKGSGPEAVKGECPICGRKIVGRGMGPHLAACRRREELNSKAGELVAEAGEKIRRAVKRNRDFVESVRPRPEKSGLKLLGGTMVVNEVDIAINPEASGDSLLAVAGDLVIEAIARGISDRARLNLASLVVKEVRS